MKNRYFLLILNLYPPVFFSVPSLPYIWLRFLLPFIPLFPTTPQPCPPNFSLLCFNFSFHSGSHFPPAHPFSPLQPPFIFSLHSLSLAHPLIALSLCSTASSPHSQPLPAPQGGHPRLAVHGPPLSLLQQRFLSQQQQGSGQRK